jgi:hypothetical protein
VDAEKKPGPLWREGPVDRNSEHIQLTYRGGDPDSDLPVALIALGPKLTITVEFLIKSVGGNDRVSNILTELRQELDTYLAGEFQLEIWDEAKYHCAVSPSPGCRIHWSYRFDWEKDPHASAKWN